MGTLYFTGLDSPLESRDLGTSFTYSAPGANSVAGRPLGKRAGAPGLRLAEQIAFQQLSADGDPSQPELGTGTLENIFAPVHPDLEQSP